MAMTWTQALLLTLALVLLNLLILIKSIIKPIWRFLLGSRVPVVVRTPDDRFDGLDKLCYAFKPHSLR